MRRLILLLCLAPACSSPLAQCREDDLLVVRGDLPPPSEGPVVVSISAQGDRVSLEVVAEELQHDIEFFTGDALLDEPDGEIRGAFGVAAVGEGKEVIYLRLTDDAGVLFEGGDSTIFDNTPGGGAQIAGVFSAGGPTGDRCVAEQEDATLLSVSVALDGGILTVGRDGVDGTVDSTAIRAFGVLSHERSFADCGSVDGWGPGIHTSTETTGYLFRLP